MLTKPDLKDKEIIACLQDAYGLDVNTISFLPLGADFSTAVYRVTTNTQTDYFLKLRRGEFLEASASVPRYLADLGIKQVIPPLATKTGQLWSSLASFKAILYPYVEGRNGAAAKLSDKQWIEFGATIKRFHSTYIPSTIASGIPQEIFSFKSGENVKALFVRLENEAYTEPVAAKTAEFLKSKSVEILKIIERTEELMLLIQKQSLEYVLCHADIHCWNLLIDKSGALYIVDFDTLIFAPKERDLMFIGAGLEGSGRDPIEEESIFYNGYGPTYINQDAICYYRFARIIEDIDSYCEHIFQSDEGGDDRMQCFEYLKSNFLPGNTIERAYQADNTRKVL